MSTQSFEFEAWFDREYPQDECGARPKYRETMVMDLMRSAFQAAEAAATERMQHALH